MNITIIGLLILAASLFNLPPVYAENEIKWDEGGTLQNATFDEWRESSYQNKSATAAYYIYRLETTKGIIERAGHPAFAKILALDLAICIDEISRSEKSLPVMDKPVAAAAFICSERKGWTTR